MTPTSLVLRAAKPALETDRFQLGYRMMTLRSLVSTLIALGCVLTTPIVGGQEKVARVGYLTWSLFGPYSQVTQAGFDAGLRAEGFVEGRNLTILRRAADYDANRFLPLAREMSDAKVDVFFAPATVMAAAAWRAARDTPIVIATILDPVELGFVKSLGRPGTQVTGVTAMTKELIPKRLQLLLETVPGIKRVAVIVDHVMRDSCKQEIDALQAAARTLGLTLSLVYIDGPNSVEPVFAKLPASGVQAVITTITSTRNGLEREYAEAALKHRLPSMHELTYGAEMGGLIAYGPDFGDVYRRAGTYVGKILKGAKPADLPVQEPTRFEMVLNLKTAKALGVSIPQAILQRADRVIE